MTTNVAAYQAVASGAPLEKGTIERRDLRPDDIRIEIEFAGICHSDIHTVREEWGPIDFPMVPGHEIIGRVTEVGSEVSKFTEGERAGVGCLVDSCRECEWCLKGEENNCPNAVGTYNGVDRFDGRPTDGGYATEIVVSEAFALHIPENLDPAATTPLLCAGITTYSPLRTWGVTEGSKVAVVGMGGLGHVAVKLAKAMGAEVTVISQTRSKEEDGRRFGATDWIARKEDPEALKNHKGVFDVIINTVSAHIDVQEFMATLRPHGAMVLLGLPTEPLEVSAPLLIGGRKSLTGSNIGGIRETQEMLDFCGDHGVTAEIELINADDINDAYDRVVGSDVRYRFVIDAKTF
ncbi:NAD(P)-dependent alcohol dehydrogenase [Kocuria sp. cx-455]|uniref:NAD(P)-dependent alcohol dehydrogenase n=1 Tax=Kocuria sp. cx-455 TaxID=2771377 RepID=UPI00168643AC|nr:NAD(P)-dependent alcohol dehydrogenase [Kocuria sp. cx-455]MBD2766016.1 NAD(P)-dependent alcohol dehydrogenase [Kocuria sp. cx-455]